MATYTGLVSMNTSRLLVCCRRRHCSEADTLRWEPAALMSPRLITSKIREYFYILGEELKSFPARPLMITGLLSFFSGVFPLISVFYQQFSGIADGDFHGS